MDTSTSTITYNKKWFEFIDRFKDQMMALMVVTISCIVFGLCCWHLRSLCHSGPSVQRAWFIREYMLDLLPAELHGPVWLAVGSVCKSHLSCHPLSCSNRGREIGQQLWANSENPIKLLTLTLKQSCLMAKLQIQSSSTANINQESTYICSLTPHCSET